MFRNAAIVALGIKRTVLYPVTYVLTPITALTLKTLGIITCENPEYRDELAIIVLVHRNSRAKQKNH